MTQALTKNALEPFRQALVTSQKHFAAAIPETVKRYMTPERITKITLAAISRSPKLLECTPQSVLKSVMEAVSLGLEPSGGVLGHAYLVPYRNKKNGNRYEAQLIVGYRGFIDLARRSTLLRSVEAHVVYENDEFQIEFGDSPKLVHRPMLTGDRGEIVAAYSIAHLADGARHCEVMTRSEIDAIRTRSRAAEYGPWVTDYAEMCRKTVVRRAAKYWPLSAEMVRALETESVAEAGEDLTTSFEVFDGGAVEDSAPQPKTKRIAAKVRKQKEEPPADVEDGEGPTTRPDVGAALAGIANATTAEELERVWASLNQAAVGEEGMAKIKAAYGARLAEVSDEVSDDA